VQSDCAEPLVRAAELPFAPVCEKQYPAGLVGEKLNQLKEPTVRRLTLLIDEVPRNPKYRDNANRLRQVIANTNGLEKAVDLSEEALGLDRPL
jgi:hypothetical protein